MSTYPACLIVICLLLGFPVSAAGQVPRTSEEWEEPLAVENWDYFDHDEYADAKLKQVELHHLSQDTFGRHFRESFYPGAMGDLRFTLSFFPNHPKALSLLVTVTALADKPFAPSRYFQKALALFPQHAVTRAQYGMYLTSVGMVEPGIEELKRSLKIDPKLAMAYAGLSKAYQRQRNQRMADEMLKKARDLGYQGNTLDDR